MHGIRIALLALALLGNGVPSPALAASRPGGLVGRVRTAAARFHSDPAEDERAAGQAPEGNRRLLGFGVLLRGNRPPSLLPLRAADGSAITRDAVDDFTLVTPGHMARFRLDRDWVLAPYLLEGSWLSARGFQPAIDALTAGDWRSGLYLASTLAAGTAGYHVGDLALRVGHFLIDGYPRIEKLIGHVGNHHAAGEEQSSWSAAQVMSGYIPPAIALGAGVAGLGHLLPSDLHFAADAFAAGAMVAPVAGNVFHREAHRDLERERAAGKGLPLPFPPRGKLQRAGLAALRATGFAPTPRWHNGHHGNPSIHLGNGAQVLDRAFDRVSPWVVTQIARLTARSEHGPSIHLAFQQSLRWLKRPANLGLMLLSLKKNPEVETRSSFPGPSGIALPNRVPKQLAAALGADEDQFPSIVAYLKGQPAQLGEELQAQIDRALAAVPR